MNEIDVISADPKYFDYAASSPPFTESLKKFEEISAKYFANPSSMHRAGRKAQQKLNSFKNEFSALINFYDGRLLLCSSGTEANNTIIEGHLKWFREGKLLIAADVHDCIWYATERYPEKTMVLPVDAQGRIDLESFEKALENDVTLVCINHVSHELGTIHPVAEMAGICNFRGIRMLVDGAQALGHLPVDLSEIPCDYYTFSSHKFGGTRGTGGIFFRDDQFYPLFSGGKQEWEHRAGTENPAGLAAGVEALKKQMEMMGTEHDRLNALKKMLRENIAGNIPGALLNGPPDGHPGILSVSFPGHSGQTIVAGLSLAGFAVSTGSACQANAVEPSRIILALGRKAIEAKGTIRISMGYGTTEESVHLLTGSLANVIRNNER